MKGVDNMKNISNYDIYGKKWNELFDNEAELLNTLLQLNFNNSVVCKGYIYLESFQKYYDKYGKLTDKQITQLKRLSKNVYWLYRYQQYKNYGLNGELLARK